MEMFDISSCNPDAHLTNRFWFWSKFDGNFILSYQNLSIQNVYIAHQQSYNVWNIYELDGKKENYGKVSRDLDFNS